MPRSVAYLASSSPSADIKKDTLGGSQINESKLSTVPSATNAVNAENAANATNAANAGNAGTVGGLTAADLKLKCPSGTTAFADVCFEKVLRSDQSLASAMQTCAAAGRRLPTPGELWAFAQQPGVTIGSGEQTDNISLNGSTREAYIVSGPGSDGFSNLTTVARPFRCVAAPTN